MGWAETLPQRRHYIGDAALGGQIEYSPPGSLIRADPKIVVLSSLVELAATKPGGFLNIYADSYGLGGVVKFLFDEAMVVYTVTGMIAERDLLILEWPD